MSRLSTSAVDKPRAKRSGRTAFYTRVCSSLAENSNPWSQTCITGYLQRGDGFPACTYRGQLACTSPTAFQRGVRRCIAQASNKSKRGAHTLLYLEGALSFRMLIGRHLFFRTSSHCRNAFRSRIGNGSSSLTRLRNVEVLRPSPWRAIWMEATAPSQQSRHGVNGGPQRRFAWRIGR